jgi:hypothetical protein
MRLSMSSSSIIGIIAKLKTFNRYYPFPGASDSPTSPGFPTALLPIFEA